jgi:hypothetical protein
MSHLSSLFGASEYPSNVRVGRWQLCPPCSRGLHIDHETLTRCDCDLCSEDAA